MRVFRQGLLSFSLAVAIPALSGAQNTTGNQLHQACGASDAQLQAFCTGYVVGVIEGMKSGAAILLAQAGTTKAEEVNALTDAIFEFCLPDTATYGQYVDVVKKYLQDSPANRHESARFLIFAALRGDFPC